MDATSIAERRERVQEMTRNGMTVIRIAEALGVTDRTVTRDRVALGIANPVAIHMTDHQRATARQLLNDGCSYNEAARTIGMGGQAVRRAFPGHGWTRRQGAQWGLFVRHQMNEKAFGGKQ